MDTIARREFLKLGVAAAALSVPAASAVAQPSAAEEADLGRLRKAVRFFGDGTAPTPLETAHLLTRLVAEDSFAADRYSRGGVVEDLEQRFADLLGKERAVFMPTGTLANHLAVRILCGERRRVIAQADSHLVNDAGDCAQTLSGLNLITLAPGRVDFEAAEVAAVLARTAAGRVATGVGAISIESPVRRLDNAVFDFGRMEEISGLAREQGIGLHLDGARLPVASVHSGIAMADYARLFDTVYISLYKCYDAPSGAILAGPESLLADLYHLRRMFGGGMPYVWPFAAVAAARLEGFAGGYAAALGVARDLFGLLEADGHFAIEHVTDGTNVFRLRVSGVDPGAWRDRLAARNIHLAPASSADGRFTLKTNPTLNRSTARELAAAFAAARTG
ncbi:MAG: hypothetical protein GY838_14010 [bacterium]|nr:hypothetical protein [bacterium]